MSQREFAAAAGLSDDRLAKLEVGKVIPRLLEIAAIAAAFAISLEELVFEAPAPSASQGGPA